MIALLLALKHKYPRFWDFLERINGKLFLLWCRHPERKAAEVLAGNCPEGFSFSLIGEDDLQKVSAFLLSQPEESLHYFRPHLFDEGTLRHLHSNRSFLMMKVTENASGRIVGYYFLRCFFIGIGVAGLIVDEPFRDQGLGTAIWTACLNICKRLHLRMYATISDRNIPSLKSCSNGTRMQVVKRMADGYMLVKCK